MQRNKAEMEIKYIASFTDITICSGKCLFPTDYGFQCLAQCFKIYSNIIIIFTQWLSFTNKLWIKAIIFHVD